VLHKVAGPIEDTYKLTFLFRSNHVAISKRMRLTPIPKEITEEPLDGPGQSDDGHAILLLEEQADRRSQLALSSR
jgi:hypothetical protein